MRRLRIVVDSSSCVRALVRVGDGGGGKRNCNIQKSYFILQGALG